LSRGILSPKKPPGIIGSVFLFLNFAGHPANGKPAFTGLPR